MRGRERERGWSHRVSLMLTILSLSLSLSPSLSVRNQRACEKRSSESFACNKNTPYLLNGTKMEEIATSLRFARRMQCPADTRAFARKPSEFRKNNKFDTIKKTAIDPYSFLPHISF